MEPHTLSAASHHDPRLMPVSISVSILAVLISVVSLFGHRAHMRVILVESGAAKAWAHYNSTSIRRNYDLLLDFWAIPEATDPHGVESVKAKYREKVGQNEQAQRDIEAKAAAIENEVIREEKVADRLNFAEGCLEMALVATSMTLLTKRHLFWGIGLVLAFSGLVVAAVGILGV